MSEHNPERAVLVDFYSLLTLLIVCLLFKPGQICRFWLFKLVLASLAAARGYLKRALIGNFGVARKSQSVLCCDLTVYVNFGGGCWADAARTAGAAALAGLTQVIAGDWVRLVGPGLPGYGLVDLLQVVVVFLWYEEPSAHRVVWVFLLEGQAGLLNYLDFASVALRWLVVRADAVVHLDGCLFQELILALESLRFLDCLIAKCDFRRTDNDWWLFAMLRFLIDIVHIKCNKRFVLKRTSFVSLFRWLLVDTFTHLPNWFLCFALFRRILVFFISIFRNTVRLVEAILAVLLIIWNLVNYIENAHFGRFLSIWQTLYVELNAFKFKILGRCRQIGKCIRLGLIIPACLISWAVSVFILFLISVLLKNNVQILYIIEGKFLLDDWVGHRVTSGVGWRVHSGVVRRNLKGGVLIGICLLTSLHLHQLCLFLFVLCRVTLPELQCQSR